MTPPPPRVTREIKSPTFERAPPPVLFGYDPDEDGASSVARFVRGDPVAPPSRDRTYPLYVRRSALARMLDESTSAQPLEAMGLLAGARYEWRGQTYAIVRDAVTGEREATETTVRFALERVSLLEALDALDYPYVLVGWWHSHPGYSCFLSETDVETQQRMFRERHHRAIVVDPAARDVRAFLVDDDGQARESAFAVVEDA